jgi:ATP-dependent Clp protease ATP-binding subunit ClpA
MMFERFTTEGRAVVVLAREEAQRLRHGYVGTEHLLLGLLDEGSGVAYTVLTGAGLDRQRVRADVERIVGTGRWSIAGGTDQLGEDDAEALQAIGIDLSTVRAKLEELFGPGALDPPRPAPRRGLLRRRAEAVTSRMPFTPRAKKVLELSLREAVRLQHNYLGPEHLLLGLLREGRGLAARILTEAGVTLDELRTRTVTALKKAA